MKHIFACIIFLSTIHAFSQEIPEHITNKNIYAFLDELATNKLINLNSVAKPYSKSFITEKLSEAKLTDSLLNMRQKKELEFYLQSYFLESEKDVNLRQDFLKKNKKWALSVSSPGVFYKDSFAKIWLKPILGYEIMSNENGNITHSWGGLELEPILVITLQYIPV